MPIAKPAWPVLQREYSLSVGLIAAYPFFEGDGSTLNDLSGRRNNSTAWNNSPAWVGGPFGSALSLNGTNQSVYLGNGLLAAIDGRTEITIVGWFKGTNGQSIVRLQGSNFAYVVVPYSGSPTALISVDSPQAFATNFYDSKWHQFALTWKSGGRYTLYVDGKVDADKAAATATLSVDPGSAYPAILGQFGGGGEFTNGSIDGILIYNRALSDAEVAQLYFDPFSIYRPKRRVPQFTVIGTGSQNLSPSLFTNTNSFFAATVAAGVVNLTPNLFTNTSTFFAPTVSSVYTLTLPLFTNSNAFFSSTVVTAGNLGPSLFTNTSTFFSPTVGRGVVDLAPTLFANSNIFYSPIVAVAQPQALLPSLYTNPNTFFLPVVRSHIVLVNVYVKLKAPHVFSANEYPADTIFGPDQSTIPVDFQYTPLMEGLSADSIAAVAQISIDVFGRYDAHGNLLDNPPIPRPIYDPQPTPVVGDKHFLPLGNGSWP